MDRNRQIGKGRTGLTLLWFSAVLFLTAFILFPLFCVFAKVSLSTLKSVFSQERFRKTLLNTFVECLCSTGLSVLMGYLYAYAVVFGRIPFRKFFASLPVLHLVTPPFVGGLAFILLLGRQGLITKTVLHLDVSLYGFPGLLIAQSLCFFPLAYLILKESFESLNRNLLEGAVSLGASRLKVFTRVVFPLTFPALLTSFLFIAVSVLSDFGNPMLVGGRFKVLSVEIYTQLTGWMNAGTSATLGLILLVPSLALFFLQNRLYKKQSKTAVSGGKGGTVNIVSALSSSGKKSGYVEEPVFRNSVFIDVLLFCFVAFVALAVILQFASIVAGSFQKLWGIDRTFTWAHLSATLKYGKDFLNTIFFAFTASCLSVIIAAFVSFCVHRTGNDLALRNACDHLIQIPSAIPGSLFGLALSLGANLLGIRAPHFLILMAITVSFMPFSYRIVTSAFLRIRPTMDEGAMSLGAGPLKVFVRILVPLIREGISGGWTYNFARGVGTLSAVIFLVSFNTPLCSVRILNLAEQGDWGRAAAMAMELTILTFVIILVGKTIWKEKKF